MARQKLISLAMELEDPNHPLLGPTVKGLYLFGLWQTGSKLRTVTYNIAHIWTVIFACTEFIDIYTVRYDLNKVLNNLSITVVTLVCNVKAFSYIKRQKEWRELVTEISREEIIQLKKADTIVTEQMNAYKKYTRIVTYLYWMLVFSTNLLLIMTPALKYVSSSAYREEISRGEEPLPQIVCSWFPFDNTKMPGYVWGVCFHVIMGTLGCGVLAVYDMNAVAIMSYLKGQMRILKRKCRCIFHGPVSRETVLERIMKCHRHHTVLLRHFRMFDALLSPTMFSYVLVCSCSICCSVIQFNLPEVTKSQKFWVIQYSTALVLQLFLFCWHGNEVAVETKQVDRGAYESDWWKGDKKLRQLTMLLAAKLDVRFTLKAGPFVSLSVPAFINIIKGTYSFYTLFSQMQTEN